MSEDEVAELSDAPRRARASQHSPFSATFPSRARRAAEMAAAEALRRPEAPARAAGNTTAPAVSPAATPAETGEVDAAAPKSKPTTRKPRTSTRGAES